MVAVAIAVAVATLPGIASLAQVLAVLVAVAPVMAGVAARGTQRSAGLARRAHSTR